MLFIKIFKFPSKLLTKKLTNKIINMMICVCGVLMCVIETQPQYDAIKIGAFLIVAKLGEETDPTQAPTVNPTQPHTDTI